MIFQLIDAGNDRSRTWTGSAASAIRQLERLQKIGQCAHVADYRNRVISASDLVDCARRENERHAAASLRIFKKGLERGR